MSETGDQAGFLLLEDGTLFHGTTRTRREPSVAEVVFTTNMTGYQEVFTDPSYRGQIVVMTTPLIGNYGANDDDPESAAPQIAGVVVRELTDHPSNWRARRDLRSWLESAQITVLEQVDTRRLTRHLRSAGVMRGVIGVGDVPDAQSVAALEACPSMEGLDLASAVSTKRRYAWGDPNAGAHIVAYDYGIKRNILRLFADHGCRVTVVPADTPAAAALELAPNGVFLSNGPGDPAAVTYAPPIIRQIVESEVPVLGICLGHQLLGLTFGGRTEKMPYGHRGGNHPVRELESGRVLITSQNHGFAVVAEGDAIAGAPELVMTHVNLNDGTVEGLKHRELPVYAVQYHPEAAPGPHDARPLFSQFMDSVRSHTSSSEPNA
ncbi:MAG TPA: glutamine-hydrolyzing carbamoyl-phosphate synthase small subunit [Vicinamibacterales bacterium]|nr:glutamine-hydrolyzing carbamoyl-phosphate synthase small subunit [Gemmatimonadaceae bacterium]HWT45611.1 glutamine-hydrolyzing carbamoyl-phosphate synthase small subunit [Vicinamibacterales bacterium]